MKPLFGIPVAFLLALSLAACSEDPAPPPPKPKTPPTATVRATVDGKDVNPSQRLPLGTRVVVHGDDSVGKGALTYHWTLHRPALSEATFEFEGESKNAFTVDAGGVFQVELVVEDANGESEPAIFELLVSYPAPTAALSLQAPDPTVALDHEVVADGSASTDPSGQPLTYTFRLTNRPVGSKAVIEWEGSRATFAPDRGGTYTVGLKVRNETTESEEVLQSIEVQPPRNRAPIANAGTDFGHPLGVEVTLNGSRSTDPDGDELSYAWRFVSQPEGSTATIANADQEVATFTPEVEGLFVVELEVSDGEFTSQAEITITVTETPNRPPQITNLIYDNGKGSPRPLPRVEAFETVEFGATVILEPEVYDPDPDTEITVRWELLGPEESEATLLDLEGRKKSLTADVDGIYTVIVTANDGEFDSEPFSVKIRFLGDNKFPVAMLKTPDGVVEFDNGTLVQLDGSDSHDTDTPPDAIEIYDWKLIRRPPGATGGFDRRGNFPMHEYRMQRKGLYTFQLVVEDVRGGVSEPATLDVLAKNRPPVARADAKFEARLTRVDLERVLDPEDHLQASDVLLDAMRDFGTPSSDPDPEDTVLDFTWEIIDGPEGSNPCLTLACLPMVDSPRAAFYTDMVGDYKAMVTVSDRDPDDPKSDTLIVDIEITP